MTKSKSRATVEMRGLRSALIVCASALALASCASSGPKVSYVKKPKQTARSTEYFAEKEYGVKASPRVVNVALASMPGSKMKRLPRGGGRDQIGKPYKVRGKWYYPKEDQNYRASGTASWYGDAFHGRLTANGEIYDMNHLSAAHPTMPLPSYARVTNKKNGHSVIVRVNDRGPYAHNRLIDLSKRAAQLLDYTGSGTAQVAVEYIGRAPVDGQDDQYLMASYQPGTGNAPTGDQPSVMVAMNTQSNEGVVSEDIVPATRAAFVSTSPQAPVGAVLQEPFDPFTGEGIEMRGAVSNVALPSAAPLPTNRPSACLTLKPCEDIALLNGYADTRVASGHASARAFSVLKLDDSKLVSWNNAKGLERILIGTFVAKDAKREEAKLRDLATVTLQKSEDGMIELYAVPTNKSPIDALLKRLWAQGYDDAFVVR